MSSRQVARRLVVRGRSTLLRHSGLVGSVVAVETAQPSLVLTFDDGPDPEGTPAVLEALAERAATATFFVLLTRVRKHPGLLQEVLAAGHEVALHGPDHRPLTGFGYREVGERTRVAKQQLEDATGRAVRWFRPPYGRQSPAGWLAVRRTGLEPVLWGPTLWDWRDISQEARLAKSQEGAEPGAIVLGHDAFAGAADGAAAETPPVLDRRDLVRRVLDGYRERGLGATSLGQALLAGRPVRRASFRR